MHNRSRDLSPLHLPDSVILALVRYVLKKLFIITFFQSLFFLYILLKIKLHEFCVEKPLFQKMLPFLKNERMKEHQMWLSTK